MTLHTKISYAKSGVRIIAGLCLLSSNNIPVVFAGLLLIVAEIGGILEEAFPGAYKGTKTDIVSQETTLPARKRNTGRLGV